MANDSDKWYTQEFSSPLEIDDFIRVLESARDECYPCLESERGQSDNAELLAALKTVSLRFQRDDIEEHHEQRESGLIGVRVFITYDEFENIQSAIAKARRG